LESPERKSCNKVFQLIVQSIKQKATTYTREAGYAHLTKSIQSISFRRQEAYHSLVLFMALERSSFFFRDKSPPAGTVFSPRSTMAGTDFEAHARYFFLCYSGW